MEVISNTQITSVKKIVGSINNLLSEQEVLSYDIETGFFPVSYRKNHSLEELQSSYKTKIITSSEEDITFTEITTQSPDGPLTGSQDDVATVLMSLYENQIKDRPERIGTDNQDKVFYTDTLICEVLGLSKNSANKVKRDIQKLLNQSINIFETKYKSSEKPDSGVTNRTLKDGTFLLIQGSETLSENKSGKTVYTKYKWVQLHPYISERIRNNMISNVDFNIFIKLKTGPRRKVYRFLQSKRKLFGDEFTFDLEELIQVLGKQGTKRPESEIKKFLRDIKKELPELDFWVSLNDEKRYIVFVKFTPALMIESKPLDDFYTQICEYYGKEKIEELDIHEIDIQNIRKEGDRRFVLKKQSDFYLYNSEKLNPSEFAMDLALWQVIEKGYECISFKGIVAKILDSLIDETIRLPDGYRYYIKKRLADRKKQELREAEQRQMQRELMIKKESERQKEKHFLDFYENTYLKDSKYRKKVKELAKDNLIKSGMHENDFGWDIKMQDEERIIVREQFFNGEATKNSTRLNKPRPMEEAFREDRERVGTSRPSFVLE